MGLSGGPLPQLLGRVHAMNDLDVSVTSVIATILWAIGIGLAMIALLTDFDVGALGVISAASGATLNVRGFFVKLEHRDRNTFELGRDYESSRVHSVN